MTRFLSFLLLVYPTISDCRHREFAVWPVLAGAGAEAVILMLSGCLHSPEELLAGCVPGLLICLYSFITKGAVGMGDGLCILLTGLFLGMEEILQISLFSFLAAAVIGLVMLMRGQRCVTMAFMPIFTAVYILSWAIH